VAVAACGGQSLTVSKGSPESTPTVRGTRPTTSAAAVSATVNSTAFCVRFRHLAASMSAVSSPTAATVVADAAGFAGLAHDAPPSVRAAVQSVAAMFASYADAVRRAGPDPGAQASAIIATALSSHARRFTVAFTRLRRYASSQCQVELGSHPGASADKLESFDIDEAIRHDKRFWTLPVSTGITTIMGSTTVNISASSLNAANSLILCQDVAGVVYTKAPDADIEVGSSPQHILARSTKPGGCTTVNP
jgi:hypothetical protein